MEKSEFSKDEKTAQSDAVEYIRSDSLVSPASDDVVHDQLEETIDQNPPDSVSISPDSGDDAEDYADLMQWAKDDLKYFCPAPTIEDCDEEENQLNCEGKGCKWLEKDLDDDGVIGEGEWKCVDTNRCCGTGWWKVDYAKDIMQVGYLKNGNGVACTNRMNSILDDLANLDNAQAVKEMLNAGEEIVPELMAEEQEEKTLIIKLFARENKILQQGERIVYGFPPKDLFEQSGYVVLVENSVGDVVFSKSFGDPYNISIENDGLEKDYSVLDNIRFSWLIPFAKDYSKIIVVNDELGDVVFESSLKETFEKFCVNNPNDSDCIVSISVGTNQDTGGNVNPSQNPLNIIVNFFSSLFSGLFG